MKPFESLLAPKLEEYIAYRHSLGYTDKNLKASLLLFDQYLRGKKADWDSLNPSFFLEFRKDLKGEPRTVNGIICSARGFFQFLVRQGSCVENPLADIPPYTERAYIPFVFSPTETEQLLGAIQKRLRKTERHFLKDLTGYLAIVLLARCGLRISEPLQLLRTHYRACEGILYIEKTKFKKDRLIPAPKSAVAEIENYLAVRSSLVGCNQNPYLLAGQKQAPLSTNQIYRVFHQSLRDIGLDQPRRSIANVAFGSPTPHSLRHSFAVNTLKRIKEQGKSPQAALPILAAYMGHRKYRYTAVYLKVLDAEQRQGLVDFAISQQEEI
jgi:integrase/recombinase XerD